MSVFKRFTFLNAFNEFLKNEVLLLYSLLERPLRIRILLLIVLMLIQASVEIITILGVQQLGMAMGNPQALGEVQPYKYIFSSLPALKEWIIIAPERFLFMAAIGVVIIVVIKNLIAVFTMYKTINLSENISLCIGSEIMKRYLYSGYIWHLSRKSGRALQVMLWRTHLSNMLVQQLSSLTNIIICTILFVGFVIIEPMLSIIVLSVIFFGATLLYSVLKRNTDRAGNTVAQAQIKENETIIAATRGIRDVIIYAQQNAFWQVLENSIKKAINSKIIIFISSSLPTYVLEILGFLMIPIAIILLSSFGKSLESIVSAIMLLMLTAWRVLPYLNRAVGQMVSIRGLRPPVLEVLRFLQMLRSNHMELSVVPKSDFCFDKEISLENVSFSYPTSQKESLNQVSLIIPKGKLIGLIGHSGAGKSTICNLLSGLCKPTNGLFMVDGKVLDDESLVVYRRHVGFVPQDPFLMAGTLAENVAFSQWGKEVDVEKVIRACKQAAIDFIPLDAQGIMYAVGENGEGLSGGQAQRVSIARALYSEPDIVIFDEATSALDKENENIIGSSIEQMHGKVTCIIIAHRLSTVEKCDIIYWLDKGSVVMSGSPEEVLPKYREIYKKSASSK